MKWARILVANDGRKVASEYPLCAMVSFNSFRFGPRINSRCESLPEKTRETTRKDD